MEIERPIINGGHPGLVYNQHVVRRRHIGTLSSVSLPALIWLMLVVLGLSLLGETGGAVAWVVTGLWTLRGSDEALEGLMLSLLLTYSNQALFAAGSLSTTLRWVVLGLAILRVGYAWAKAGFVRPPWLKFAVIFVLTSAASAVYRSALPSVSILKLLSYLLGSVAIYLGIRLGKRRDWGNNIIAFGAVIAFTSLPLLGSPLGYLKSASAFQGILSHPQSYGVIMAMPLAYASVRWILEGSGSPRWYHLFTLGAMTVTSYLAGARTGYFAVMLGIITALIFHGSFSRVFNVLISNPLTYFAAAAVIIWLWVANPVTQIELFLFERSSEVYAAYGLYVNDHSLGHLVGGRALLSERSWNNFLKSPIIGNGFGMPSLMGQFSYVETWFSIPVSLPAEKGFLVTALLEDVGLIGFTVFLLLIISQLRSLKALHELSLVVLFLTALLVNLGESVYFAMGGIGILVHVSMSIALATADKQSADY